MNGGTTGCTMNLFHMERHMDGRHEMMMSLLFHAEMGCDRYHDTLPGLVPVF